MPNLHDIERRIKSVTTTQQITRTMEMVAAAKIRRASERVESALPWAVAISDMLISTAKYAHLDNEPLLQVHDDGRITDSQGRTVDFKNTIIILTSNLGSQYLLEGIDMEGNITDSAKDAVMGELHRAFRPEFLNRLDETILFKPLT